jgi:hypothetical protein
MNAETIKNPWQVEVGDIILRHPDHPETIGDPRMANGITNIPYTMADGGEGVFALYAAQTVSVRPATTYRVHAYLTHDERAQALLAMTPNERTYIAAELAHRYGEVFDAVYVHLLKARTADAACLRDEVAS